MRSRAVLRHFECGAAEARRRARSSTAAFSAVYFPNFAELSCAKIPDCRIPFSSSRTPSRRTLSLFPDEAGQTLCPTPWSFLGNLFANGGKYFPSFFSSTGGALLGSCKYPLSCAISPALSITKRLSAQVNIALPWERVVGGLHHSYWMSL